MANNADAPAMFRLNVEVGDLKAAAALYQSLFNVQGRLQAGHRVYVPVGPVTLQVVDVSSQRSPHPCAKALYFTVEDLDAAHTRAKALNVLSAEQVHGAPAGEPIVRPWGERSFYVDDPWGNQFCFVEAGTAYAG
jgi:predicted enzyme related to lactoylglutathione lyase